MASTRNKNTPGNYQSEQAEFTNKVSYLTQPFYSNTDTTFLPGNGLLQGGIYHSQLATNGNDIESYLRGIGATNLTGESFQVQPQIKTLKSLNIADVRPSPTLIPENLVIDGEQRPYPLK